MWGWGSPKSSGADVRWSVGDRPLDPDRGPQRQPADRHVDDADPRGLDDKPRRLSDRCRHVCSVRSVPGVRAAAQEHRVRLRSVSRRLEPLSAACRTGHDRGRQLRRRDFAPLRIKGRVDRGLLRGVRSVPLLGPPAQPPVRHPDQRGVAWDRDGPGIRGVGQPDRGGSRAAPDRRGERHEHGDADTRAARWADRSPPPSSPTIRSAGCRP